MNRAILVLNAGSSSVKFQLFGEQQGLPLLAYGQVAGLGGEPSFFACSEGATQVCERALPNGSTHEDAAQTVLHWIENRENSWTITAAGHRVVHGGPDFSCPVVIDDIVLKSMRKLSPLAPLHQPHNLAAIEILSKLKPGLEQIACFDTAFHARHAHLFKVYALPYEFMKKGVRRYGFHGLSYEWISHVLKQDHPRLAKGRVIAAHLGSGASLCALKNGESVDTTMGMTALDGLPMGTRCGSIDPGALIYMIREMGMTVDEVERMLYNDSGLKGLSSMSGNVKDLLKSERRRAKFALDYFSLKVAQFAGAMAVSMGGVDALVFTGGIGENAEPVRNAIIKHLDFLGSIPSLVIPANEERMIATHVQKLL